MSGAAWHGAKYQPDFNSLHSTVFEEQARLDAMVANATETLFKSRDTGESERFLTYWDQYIRGLLSERKVVKARIERLIEHGERKRREVGHA